MTRPAVLLALLLSAAGAARAAELKEAGLRWDAPAKWMSSRDAELDARQKVFGILMVGPRAKAPAAPSIALEFYAAGNVLFADPAAFLKSNTFSAAGEKIAVTEKTLAGRKAKVFTRSRGKGMREETWVLEDPKGGFHALRFSAAAASFDAQRKDFEKVLKSVKFLP